MIKYVISIKIIFIYDIEIIYIIKSKGPNTDHWDTSEVNCDGLDNEVTDKIVFSIQNINQCRAMSHIPISIRRLLNISRFMYREQQIYL